MELLPESAGPTCVNNCPFARTGPLRTKSRCEVPKRFTPGWHSGDAGVCLWAVHGATELHLGPGWCVSVSQPPAEVCLMDLAWDYPGV